mgnify:CR=1 FL=1
MEAEKAVRCQAVFEILSANREGDDVVLNGSGTRLHFLRQQSPQGHTSLADFIAPTGTPGLKTDHIGVFCVTAGHGLEEWCAPFRDDDDDYRWSHVSALARNFDILVEPPRGQDVNIIRTCLPNEN